MAWFYEILGQDDGVLETSDPIYSSKYEAEWAGYRRVKERPDYLIGEIPSGGKEGGLHSVAVIGPAITAKQKEQ